MGVEENGRMQKKKSFFFFDTNKESYKNERENRIIINRTVRSVINDHDALFHGKRIHTI